MAVYTTLAKNDIDAFLTHYDVGSLISCKGIAEGVENTNYLLTLASPQGEKEKYILTVFEQRVKEEELPFFMQLTHWLADRGIVCPRPVTGHDGQDVRRLKGKPAALIHYLHGRGNPHITPYHLTLVGEAAARMHVAARDFPLQRPNALSLAGWRALFERFRLQADRITPGLETEMEAELQTLATKWPASLPSGVIHADLFPDNVFFLDGHTDQPELSGVIDFYFACNDFWMYDLAICMNAWCFDARHHFVPARAQALLGAYQRVRAFTPDERKALPALARGACMRFLVTRAHDWLHRPEGALVNPKDPMEYVAKLRFHQRIQDAGEYGLAS